MGDFLFTDPGLACDLGLQLAYKCAEELAKDDSKQVGLMLPDEDNYREPSALVAQILGAAKEYLGKTGALQLTEDVMIYRLDSSVFHPTFTRGPVIVPFVSMAEAGRVRTRATTVIWVPAAVGDIDMSLVQEWNGQMLVSSWGGALPYVAYTPSQQQDLGY